MPLLRDQKTEARVKTAAPPATTDYRDAPLRQEHSEQAPVSLSIREMDKFRQRASIRLEGPGIGGKHQLDERGIAPVQPAQHIYGMKMNTPDTLNIHKAASTQNAQNARQTQSSGFHIADKRRVEPQPPATKTKKSVPEEQKTSAFDDTTTISESYFESAERDEETALLRPQGVSQYSEQEDVYNQLYEDSEGMGQNGALTYLPPNWEIDVENEKRYQAEKHIQTPQPKRPRERNMQVGSRSQHPQTLSFKDRQEPDTPSRAQSAPPDNDMVSRKNVRIEELPQIMNPSSPDLISSEMAREDSLDQLVSRPNSAQPERQDLPVHPRPQQPLHQPQNQIRQSSAIPSHAPRFHSMHEHVHNSRQGNPKVSAPDSDNQDFSEDERAQFIQQPGDQEQPLMAARQSSVPAKKRSYDDMSYELDYSSDELKQKKLSELQAEPYPEDPKAVPRTPPRDNGGNEMSLNQILGNLSKMSEEAQRETFRTLTDEQWASTGQWFVDKFQSDLKRLMAVRLQRRQVAMAYEDKIRRRQRVVEQHQAHVDKELQELQTGGRQLVNGRKVPTGSRSATPMKGGR